jgi:hypothetical protein
MRRILHRIILGRRRWATRNRRSSMVRTVRGRRGSIVVLRVVGGAIGGVHYMICWYVIREDRSWSGWVRLGCRMIMNSAKRGLDSIGTYEEEEEDVLCVPPFEMVVYAAGPFWLAACSMSRSALVVAASAATAGAAGAVGGHREGRTLYRSNAPGL